MSLYIVGFGGENDNTSIRLETKKKRFIPNSQPPERPPESLKEAIKICTSKVPGITFRRASATYNCVGMVFASRRTAIEPEHLQMIIEDDGYKRIRDEKDVKIGDIVLYRDRNEYTHIGIIVGIEPDIKDCRFEFTVLSQWGRDGEYVHSVEKVPEEYGNDWEFWTEREEFNGG
ncbi:hypothetical protein VB780_26005 [Leptolyngbya sp. CCNP1308]|uniref:hypothetical protein n=1 Tax=Leptolyngbya sp. CCNP1308 TaxID=3110255 RepID=UPI002B1FF752|nr:hypothetical protein [Leptolyngbya sp. CCNP1308]MEA5452055.1 hypothetical protein [Leptolyngbya sp. CCNP1308]